MAKDLYVMEQNNKEVWVGEVLENAIPVGADSRQREILASLSDMGIHFRVAECSDAVSIEQCEAVGKALGATLVKTLFVSNRQKTRFHLVSMPGHKPFVTRQFTHGRGVSRVSFVDAPLMMSMLATPVGGAGPLSVLYDAEGKVEMVLDRELENCGMAALPVLSPNMYIAVDIADIADRFLPAAKHSPVVIDMTEE